MQAYLLFLEIDPTIVGERYDMLPLHCTLVHWFWLDKKRITSLDEQVAQLVKGTSPVHIVAGEEKTFVGYTKNGSIPVTVHKIQYNEEIDKLHYGLCDILDGLNVRYSIPEYTKEGYVPHATNQKTGKLKTGEARDSASIYLAVADAPEYGNERQVIKRFDFVD